MKRNVAEVVPDRTGACDAAAQRTRSDTKVHTCRIRVQPCAVSTQGPPRQVAPVSQNSVMNHTGAATACHDQGHFTAFADLQEYTGDTGKSVF